MRKILIFVIFSFFLFGCSHINEDKNNIKDDNNSKLTEESSEAIDNEMVSYMESTLKKYEEAKKNYNLNEYLNIFDSNYRSSIKKVAKEQMDFYKENKAKIAIENYLIYKANDDQINGYFTELISSKNNEIGLNSRKSYNVTLAKINKQWMVTNMQLFSEELFNSHGEQQNIKYYNEDGSWSKNPPK
ncbi:hypothetical protein [Metabacillus niabensis]|uniref:hypothetical protein n=1 Tax=Metabacillus niabensis TaxID=324854 RepID=UPI0039A325D9